MFSPIQVILILSFMAMPAHQVEEYGYPGGFPTVTNLMVTGEKDIPDRYPLNANQCTISNTLLTYLFYIAAMRSPGLVSLGLAQVGLGLFQILAHRIAVPVRIKRLYNPGLATPVPVLAHWYLLHSVRNGQTISQTREISCSASSPPLVRWLPYFCCRFILLRN